MVRKLMNLITRIDEGMTTQDDTRTLVIGIFLVFAGSFITGVAAGSLIGIFVR